ncbi:MAG: tRNA pseudouridine(38-40) synthase TruA [Dehalococcoidia bacterium]|jgi:tRNA pseudouridine38-40 synthase|nr:tRNA pseudouridine(38-40) synthase TruA [Dehalococcoidia bacterium]
MRFGLVVEYDGTEFHGSQLQSNARTVQGELENALRQVFNKNIRVHFASRTDSGVHARGQVGRFDEDTDMAPDQVRKALNHYMAEDVRIRCVQAVPDGPDGFDPRGDASSRTYVYTFNDARSEPALDRHFVTHVRKPLDAAAMNDASQALVGSHDFAAFAGPAAPLDAPTRRVVETALVTRTADRVEFRLTANAFLHQQIRRIAGVLYSVGTGTAPAGTLGELVDSNERGAAAHVMPAQGLCLEEISYNGAGECGLPAISPANPISPSVN